MSKDLGFGIDAKCPVCGKEFNYYHQHVYKRIVNNRTVHYCSYTCFRKSEKEIEEKRKNKRRL